MKDLDYFRIAAGFYQSKDLPDNYLDMLDEDFNNLLAENAWEPFDGWTGENIEAEIHALSEAMTKIAREAKLAALEDVIEKINPKPTY